MPDEIKNGDAGGYGRPPLATRFKKGISGNPRGRPKGSRNFQNVLRQALDQKVMVTEGGKRRQRSKLQVLVAQVVNSALSGNLKAAELVMKQSALAEPAEGRTATPDLAVEREMARAMITRLRGLDQGSSTIQAGPEVNEDE